MTFYNVTIYYDATNGGRQEYDWGLHTIVQSIADQFTYELILINNVTQCIAQNTSGPSLHENTHLHMMVDGRANNLVIQGAFPNMTGFVYKGEVFCPHQALKSKLCNQWELTSVMFNRTNVYEFYTHADTGYPYLYEWQGFNTLFGSHFDHYRFFYDHYEPGYTNANLVKKPLQCHNTEGIDRQEVPSKFQKNTPFHKLFHGIPSAAHQQYRQFIGKFGKQHKSQEEYNLRMLNFASSLHFVNEHNAKKATFTAGINHLADAHDWERRMMFGLVSSANTNAMRVHEFDQTVQVPDSIDWRTKNAVSPVKDQGFCGSCWAFSTTGALESAHYLKTGVMTQLSQQILVDCASNAGAGCDGGMQGPAYDYINMNGGIPDQIGYGDYMMINQMCRKPHGEMIKISGYVNVTANDENALKQAIATVGPVAVSIDASQLAFSYYQEGVFYAEKCSSTNLDHAVLAVGYGTENGQDYWLVKNSWSTYWGNGGYIKMARNRNNNCGIATAAVYPLAI
jgi:C1A family cysteine protease